MEFKRATKKQSKLRAALVGPSGSGKTYSALRIARGIVGDAGRIAVIDTERGSASKYSDVAEFDVLELDSYSVENFIGAIAAAQSAGYDLTIIDSLSHAWAGKDGLLEFVDNEARRSKSGNSFAAWRNATPKHNALIDAMLNARTHIIVTMRSKTEYVLEEDSRGKKTPRKVGMQPVQRDGLEYEFDIVGDLDHEHVLVVSKSRCLSIADAVVAKPDEAFGATLAAWLSDGVPADAAPAKDDLLAEQRRRWKHMADEYNLTTPDLREYAESRGVNLTDVTGEQMRDLLDALEAQRLEAANADAG